MGNEDYEATKEGVDPQNPISLLEDEDLYNVLLVHVSTKMRINRCLMSMRIKKNYGLILVLQANLFP
jgi:hypothetical protein